MRNSLVEAASLAIISSEFEQFGIALATETLPQSFGVLGDAELVQIIADQLGGGNPAEWVVRPRTWNAELYTPDAKFQPAEQLLHLLWQDLRASLARKMDAVGKRANVAPQGAILCFFGRAEFSMVIEYKRSASGAMDLRPLIGQSEPNGVLDLTNLLDHANPAICNAVKKVVISVDKLVFHRGSIVHVDRQREDVFGPTIDTVVLGELIAEWLETEPECAPITALEIGPGSGLLSTILASSDRVGALTSIDLNSSAVICTLKNLHINNRGVDGQQNIRVRAEKFSACQITDRFDLIACNPPYIPEFPGPKVVSDKEYRRAVGGTELCAEILTSLPDLLTERGRLLLMTSSISDREIIALIPPGFRATAGLAGEGRRVPLDVDVVWRSPTWQAHLVRNNRIEADSRGRLWHYLRPLWIMRE